MYHLDPVNHSKHKFNVCVNESKSKEANQMERKKKDAKYSSKTKQLGITYLKAINDNQLMLFYKVWIYLDGTPQCINAHVLVIVILIMFHTNTCWMKLNIYTFVAISRIHHTRLIWKVWGDQEYVHFNCIETIFLYKTIGKELPSKCRRWFQ
jgi:hypothetical protein